MHWTLVSVLMTGELHFTGGMIKLYRYEKTLYHITLSTTSGEPQRVHATIQEGSQQWGSPQFSQSIVPSYVSGTLLWSHTLHSMRSQLRQYWCASVLPMAGPNHSPLSLAAQASTTLLNQAGLVWRNSAIDHNLTHQWVLHANSALKAPTTLLNQAVLVWHNSAIDHHLTH